MCTVKPSFQDSSLWSSRSNLAGPSARRAFSGPMTACRPNANQTGLRPVSEPTQMPTTDRFQFTDIKPTLARQRSSLTTKFSGDKTSQNSLENKEGKPRQAADNHMHGGRTARGQVEVQSSAPAVATKAVASFRSPRPQWQRKLIKSFLTHESFHGL